MNKRAAWVLWLACACATALAHRAPNSYVQLDFGSGQVNAEMLLPDSELAFAMTATDRAAALPDYLQRHVAVETPDGKPWKLVVRAVRKTIYFDHDYLVAQIELTPPPGASAHALVLSDDAVTHEVRNHVVVVTQRGAGSRVLGALQYPERRLLISPRD